MRIVTCDDDQAVIDNIKAIIFRNDQAPKDIELTSYSNSTKLLSALEDGKDYDIFLLDILMPEINGMELAKAIRRTDKTSLIIFLTSSPEFAVDSYDVNAFGYLLKPVSETKLFALLSKARLLFGNRQQKELQIISKKTIMSISVNAIVYIESFRNKLIYRLNNNELIESYGTIKELKSKLNKYNQFAQPHRSYIINMEYIKSLDSNTLILKSVDTTIPIARSNYNTLKTQYINYMVYMAGNNNDNN